MKSIINIIIITTYAPSTLQHRTHLPTVSSGNPSLPNFKEKHKMLEVNMNGIFCRELFANAALIHAKPNLSPLDEV